MKMNFKFLEPIPPNACMTVFVYVGPHILLSPNMLTFLTLSLVIWEALNCKTSRERQFLRCKCL